MSLNPDEAAQTMLTSVLDALERGGTSHEAQKAVIARMGELIESGQGITRKVVGAFVPKIQMKAEGTVINPPVTP